MPNSVIRSVLTAYGADTEKAAGIVPPESLEYVAIKQEQQTRLLLRDTALYITIGGILTTATILGTANPDALSQMADFFSYAAPAFSVAMFLIYFRSDYYLSSARRYIVNDLGPRIIDNIAFATGVTPQERSEERRVGKECRSRCDWSSDVCSSDLSKRLLPVECAALHCERSWPPDYRQHRFRNWCDTSREIGRASCRERV